MKLDDTDARSNNNINNNTNDITQLDKSESLIDQLKMERIVIIV
jgi:hypothetical protein